MNFYGLNSLMSLEPGESREARDAAGLLVCPVNGGCVEEDHRIDGDEMEGSLLRPFGMGGPGRVA
jgi:hypothetical protein